MQSLVARVVVTALAAAGPLGLAQGPSYADTVCQVTDPETGVCLIYVEVPGTPGNPGGGGNDGPKDTGSGAACYWDGTSQGISDPPPGPVACSTEYGYWSNGYRCYITLLNPQPPAGDPNWQGHQPGDGAVYSCYQPPTDLLIWVWSQNTPPNSGAGPTPREVAQIAIQQMDLRAIDVGITPEPGPHSIGIVGMPVWMWAANPNSHTVGPISESATAGGITVTATARLHKITWDMGDGTKVNCATAGTPYNASYGKAESPDCGHTYQKSSSTQSGGKYTVTATSDWVITWAGAGQTGTIRLNGLTRTVAIAVGEAQVLVQ
ncbi:ATP/GTP-binding protein [Nocardioides phosphati]|uniref:ATP/GTP-binding protein n=2 Tax=Nocardioides phosphati TaxID=1867775 RepID=A0ABQ2N738_9ACTN|nr:ATP/GTP-binding protein [Nocardioides phosphati]